MFVTVVTSKFSGQGDLKTFLYTNSKVMGLNRLRTKSLHTIASIGIFIVILSALVFVADNQAFSDQVEITIFQTGFETSDGNMSDGGSGWTVEDRDATDWPADPYDNETYWAESSYRVHSGSRSAWAAGYGGDQVNHLYRNRMDSYASRTLDLTDYTNTSLSFWYYTVSLPGNGDYHDFIRVRVTDGGITSPIWSDFWITAGWVQQTLDLSAYDGKVISIHWVFQSDESIYREGTYIDDITITGDVEVDHVHVSPSSKNVKAGETQVFDAVAHDSGDDTVSGVSFDWTTSVSGGSVLPSSGDSTTFTAGTTSGPTGNVTATVPGHGTLTDSASVTVIPDDLDHIHVSPSSQDVAAGGTQPFSAEGQDQYHNTISSLSFNWSTDVSGSSVAPASGTSTTFTAGTTSGVSGSVYAQNGGKQGSASVSLVDGPLDHFDIGSISTPQIAFRAFSLSVIAHDQYSNVIEGFTDSVSLSDTSTTISPTSTPAFTNGTWTGDVTITAAQTNNAITALHGGSGKTGTSNTFDVELPMPTLVGPTDASSFGWRPITFSWSTVNNAEAYAIELLDAPPEPGEQNTQAESVHRIGAGITGSETTFPGDTSGLADGTTYYWRIIAVKDGQLYGVFSDHWSFTVTGKPVLVSPVEATALGWQPVNFDWMDIAGAEAFAIELLDGAPEPSEENTQAESIHRIGAGITGTESTFPGDTTGFNTYRYWWRIIAIKDGQLHGVFSDAWYFDVEIPEPDLVAPTDVSSFELEPVTFDWDDVPGAYMYAIELLDAPPESGEQNTTAESIHRIGAGFTGTESTFPGDTSGLSDGTYWWRIIAFGPLGFHGVFSDHWSFVVTAP